MRVKEIAACLACSENTVKSRLNYGRQRVKEKVEALEKQGTKLYSIAPLPFLVLLFRTMVPAEPDQKILSAVQKRYCSHTRPNGVRAWKTLPAKAVIGTIGTVAAVTAAAVIVPHIVPPTARPGITEVSASVTEAVSYEHITEPILAETEPPAAGSEMMTEEAQAQVMIFFPALLEDIRKAARIPDDAYEKAPGEYDAQYAHLGSGILWFLHHREAGVYTLDFFYREYDTDNDGSAEFLLARGISPGQCAPIAVYDTDGTIIVGDALNQCHFPKDDPEAVPGWLYLDTDA
ncbi:MAG: hypothetical protein MJ175_00885 [Clostridia bacterium]|nr:hypothetical protein [Clostridia bacterium]